MGGLGNGNASMINKAVEQSVVEHPELFQQGYLNWGGMSVRGPLLSAWGTRQREKELRQYWHHDYNTIFKGAVAGLIKRVQSTPFQIKAPVGDGDRWQKTLMLADFGSWERFLSKLIIDYHRHDQGAFIELIGPGDPNNVIYGPITGLAILDSMRCYPTGNEDYPVVYYDLLSKMHVIHRSRVIQFVDTQDTEEIHPSIGECALSRAIAPVTREILMGRYIEQFLDDQPPPGFAIFGNIGKDAAETALQKMEQDRNTDIPGPWGRTVRLYGLQAELKPTVENVSFTKAPEGFDYEKYKHIDVNEIALATGLDIQDIWEMTAAGFSQGKTSEILAQKSRGKGLGRILKSLERVINQAFPEDVQFKFVYEDPMEDQEQAQLAQTIASTIQTISSDLSTQERRQLLADLIPAVHDVITDESGKVSTLADDDPKGPLQLATAVVPQVEPVAAPSGALTAPEGQPAEVPVTVQKELDASAFAKRFQSFASHVSNDDQAGALRATFRDELYNAGLIAFQDGMNDAGASWDDLSATEKADARREIGLWLAAQTQFVTSFIDELLADGGLSRTDAATRADLWINKTVREIYFKGLAAVGADQLYRWQIDPEKDHCETCLAMNGQIHKMSDYEASGILPGSHKLECKGFNCGCSLVPASKSERERGKIPGYTVGSRLQGWLSNIFGGG